MYSLCTHTCTKSLHNVSFFLCLSVRCQYFDLFDSLTTSDHNEVGIILTIYLTKAVSARVHTFTTNILKCFASSTSFLCLACWYLNKSFILGVHASNQYELKFHFLGMIYVNPLLPLALSFTECILECNVFNFQWLLSWLLHK